MLYPQEGNDNSINLKTATPAKGRKIMKTAIELIADERQRQIMWEGFSVIHDDTYKNGELAYAAACYALNHDALSSVKEGQSVPAKWPWNIIRWKPSPNDRIKELVKAGALITAEIERLQRLNLSEAE